MRLMTLSALSFQAVIAAGNFSRCPLQFWCFKREQYLIRSFVARSGLDFPLEQLVFVREKSLDLTPSGP